MDRSTALSVLGEVPDRLIRVICDAHDDFRRGVAPDHQPTLDATLRARYVHNRIGYRASLEFGNSGPTCVQSVDSLKFLMVDAKPQGIALRWKKGHRYTFKTANHDSARQETLQSDGELLFEDDLPLAHILIAYTENEDDPLNPELERIALTRERMGAVEWQQVIWTAAAAPESVRIETGFEQLQLPVRFKVKAKPVQSDAADGTEKIKKAE